MSGEPAGRGHRTSYAERRERKAEIDDPAIVLEAAARFLEVRSRSVATASKHTTVTEKSQLVGIAGSARLPWNSRYSRN